MARTERRRRAAPSTRRGFSFLLSGCRQWRPSTRRRQGHSALDHSRVSPDHCPTPAGTGATRARTQGHPSRTGRLGSDRVVSPAMAHDAKDVSSPVLACTQHREVSSRRAISSIPISTRVRRATDDSIEPNAPPCGPSSWRSGCSTTSCPVCSPLSPERFEQ